MSINFPETREWAQHTISAAQAKLDNILFAAKRESTDVFGKQIQEYIDQTHLDDSTSDIISLSTYVDLLEHYENKGGFCTLRALSERLNARHLHDLIRSVVQEEEQAA